MLLTERHVHLLLLPWMDGTSQLFEPLLAALPATLPATAIAYPTHAPCGYDELLPLILAAIPPGPFVVVGESFSGPLAVMLAARRPTGRHSVTASHLRPTRRYNGRSDSPFGGAGDGALFGAKPGSLDVSVGERRPLGADRRWPPARSEPPSGR